MASTPNGILFICTANTCRSPMAEALLRHALAAQPEPLKSLVVQSAGIAAYPGQPANEKTVAALKKVGIKLKTHESQQVTAEMINDALAVFCMTENHHAMIHLQLDPPPENVFLMRQFAERQDEYEDLDIPDPFGGSFDQYEACRDSMVETIPSLIAVVSKLLQEKKAEA